MANLTDKAINSTYQSLLKTIDNTEINGSTEISDGLGNGTGITISNDGQITTDGTISFGTLKDAGENISISKFVDESDGISDNDNDTSIPTSAAVVDYVENKITLDDLDFTADTGSGSVDLDSQALTIKGGTNVTTEATGQTVTINATGTNLSSESTSTAVDVKSSTGENTSIGSATSTNAGILTSSDKNKLDGISSGAEVNPASTDDLSEGTSNLYYTDARVSANTDVAANTLKVGITTQQASDITTNNAKVSMVLGTSAGTALEGDTTTISAQQASDITANNAKVGITTGQADAIVANTAKTGITTEQADAIVANTAKVGITTQQASDITANNAKVGITTQQAADIVTNNAKVGITAQQASDITTNNAKISFDSTSSTKLGTIAEGAEVNVNADWNATSGDAEILNKPTIPTNNNQLTNGAGYINEAAQTIHTNAIGNAIDFSARVTLDGGVAEGTSGIIKNLQNIL
jgi:hypothetical protein